MNNQRRKKNGGVAPNKLIMSEQFKINMQECFSKKQRKINLENQLTSSDSNGIRTHNHLVRTRTLNHFAKLRQTKWLWV